MYKKTKINLTTSRLVPHYQEATSEIGKREDYQ